MNVLLLLGVVVALGLAAGPAFAGTHRFGVRGDAVTLDDVPFKVIGLRVSNALVSDAATAALIDNLDVFREHGVNTVSVFLMGSRFGDVKGYRPGATLDPEYADRLGRIITAADERAMVVLVGCLYWGNSRAKEELGHWTQADAERAVANTVRWLGEHGHRNVFVDPDNEGMARRDRDWDIAGMIAAAHAVDPSIMVAYNDKEAPPAEADLLAHFSPKDGRRPWIQTEGTPENAPGRYWGRYSKEDGYYNYLRIGRYTEAMKQDQIRQSTEDIEQHAGHVLASTWLQCGPGEGVNGPYMRPGGHAVGEDIDTDVKAIDPDAGVRWWLEQVRDRYGAWTGPSAAQ